MHKKLTITVDELVYEGLHRIIGRRKISQFIEALVRPHVIPANLLEAYRDMSLDQQRESEAGEWTEAMIGDGIDETR